METPAVPRGAERIPLTGVAVRHEINSLKAKLAELGRPDPRPASPGDLERAKDAGFPTELFDFYRQCEPDDYLEVKQRIWSIANALVENEDAVPGRALSPHGYIVFASTRCGDSYCMDTNVMTPDGHHPVVLFSHEMIEEGAPLAAILALRREVAVSLEDFLAQFTCGALAEEPSIG